MQPAGSSVLFCYYIYSIVLGTLVCVLAATACAQTGARTDAERIGLRGPVQRVLVGEQDTDLRHARGRKGLYTTLYLFSSTGQLLHYGPAADSVVAATNAGVTTSRNNFLGTLNARYNPLPDSTMWEMYPAVTRLDFSVADNIRSRYMITAPPESNPADVDPLIRTVTVTPLASGSRTIITQRLRLGADTLLYDSLHVERAADGRLLSVVDFRIDPHAPGMWHVDEGGLRHRAEWRMYASYDSAERVDVMEFYMANRPERPAAVTRCTYNARGDLATATFTRPQQDGPDGYTRPEYVRSFFRTYTYDVHGNWLGYTTTETLDESERNEFTTEDPWSGFGYSTAPASAAREIRYYGE